MKLCKLLQHGYKCEQKMTSSVQSVRQSRSLLASNSLYQVFYVRLRETAQNKSNHTVAEATNPKGETARQEDRKNRSTQQAKTISKVALESPYLATIT